MNKPIDDGGAAFPFGQVSERTGQPINGFFNPGMTLRDYFAGQALVGILSCPLKINDTLNEYARCAYAQADAMLDARERKDGDK